MRPLEPRRCGWPLAATLAGLALCAPAPTALASFAREPGTPVDVNGADPSGVVVDDFNGDKRPDVVTINGTSSNISVLLRRPIGGFVEEPGSPVGVGTGPNFGAVADFNGDARPDVAVSNYVSDNVTILLRDAAGGFAKEAPEITAGDGPASIAAADFNGDGLPDLAVPDQLANKVTILLRQPGGFAAEGGSPATGSAPRDVAAADFNGDGRPDLAVTNLNGNSVTVLLRNKAGDGFTQEAGSPIAVGAGPFGVTADDLDADRHADLVVANSKASTITVLLRNEAGDGFGQEGRSSVNVGAAPLDVATADFNGDGARDLAVTNSAASSVSVLLRAGAGYRQDAGSPVPTAEGAYGVTSADFDADGRPDLAVSNDHSNRLTVLLNTTPTGSPPPPPARPSSPSPRPRSGARPISAHIDARWSVLAKYTKVLRLAVRRVPVTARVVVRCKGRGCPFKGPRSFGRRKSTVSLTKAFKNERLRVGAVIEIAISAPGRIGAVRRYRVRGGPHRLKPKASTLCLPEGTSRPRRTC
jgi:hypothetical protein